MAVKPARTLLNGVRKLTRERGRTKTGARRLRVKFDSGIVGLLDLANARDRVWADVLESLHRSGKPAYVSVDTASRQITELLLPREFLVVGIHEVRGSGVLEIELHPSHAVHFLRPDRPQFEELRKTLDDARRGARKVLLTESLDSSTIIDVRMRD